ncbi:MAG: UvrD-helicase domain-containing protein [Chloroflexi bacterium]|nr:UvrD-helicase domain-containing protein [Chloroflexota bacterium]
MEIIDGLNPEQRRAVEYVAGPLLILAGPGSGKTRVITHRIAYLLDVCGVNPYNMLAVTFTNKAAREMVERLRTLCPSDVERLTVGTFHAFCARLLRREAAAIGLDSHFIIYDDDDQFSLVRKVLKDLDIDEKSHSPRALLSGISAAKSNLLSPMHFAEHATNYRDDVVLRVYRRYQEMLAENNGLDFDDLLMTTVRLFRERPDVLEKYQSRYEHLLVDEFQDTNVAQYALVKLLGAKHRKVCVVGDEDQSIYSWRQADIRNIQNFEIDFPEAKTVLLEQNYRSTKTILSAARCVIAANSMRKKKHLWTENADGLPIVLFEAYNEEEEANYVASEITRVVASERYRYGDCAVMYRANAQSRALERIFSLRKLPHKLVGMRFYQRKEIKDVIAYLRVIFNPYDTVSLNRIINVPNRGLGSRTLAGLDRWCNELGLAKWDGLRLLRGDRVAGVGATRAMGGASPFNARAKQLLLNLLTMFETFIAESDNLNLQELLELVLLKSGYVDFLQNGAEGEERWQNVRELFTVAREYAQLKPQAGLEAFLEDAALATDADEYDDSQDAVTLITLHGAKGLEFSVVFIVGMEEGLCPHSRSLDDPDRMEEERRLCYVGMTRAKERLYLIHTTQRSIYGAASANTPSRFLADIPPELIKESRLRQSHSASRVTAIGGPSPRTPRATTAGGSALHQSRAISRVTPPAVVERAEQQRPKVKLPSEPVFKPGDRVKHPKFGEGIVVGMNIVSDDQEVSIAFAGVGVKKLSLSFAPLERMEPPGGS